MLRQVEGVEKKKSKKFERRRVGRHCRLGGALLILAWCLPLVQVVHFFSVQPYGQDNGKQDVASDNLDVHICSSLQNCSFIWKLSFAVGSQSISCIDLTTFTTEFHNSVACIPASEITL